MYTPSLDFIFVAEGNYTPSLAFAFEQGLYCHASITLDDAQGMAVCEYDANVFRYTAAVCSAASQDAIKADVTLTALLQQAEFIRIKQCQNQQRATLSVVSLQSTMQQMMLGNLTVNDKKNAANLLSKQTYTRINLADFIKHKICLQQDNALTVRSSVLSVQDVLSFLTTRNQSKSETAAPLAKRLCSSIPYSTTIKKRGCIVLQQAMPPPFGKSKYIDLPRPPITPPTDHQTLIIPDRKVYTMHHVITAFTLPDNIAIPLSKIDLSYDVDSYSWVFSATLIDKALLPAVIPVNDSPVHLSITINGYNWVVIVERIPEKRSFAKSDITLTGRSLSAQLGVPFQLQGSYTAGSDMTVQQIADALLPYGWTLDWQCATPWLVPANTYSHTQQSPLQALAGIAQSIGAALVPSKTEQILTMQPRYPILPWNYYATGVTPDLVMPNTAIDTIGIESRTQSAINGVYVHGAQNGVLAWCKLNGSAGDVLAPTESNALITDVVAARAVGERILAGQATQPITTSVTTWLGGDFPLAEVGWLVEVNGERAIINGISISVEFGKVRQTLTFGEQTANAYSKLLHLLPSQPLLVGQLVSTSNEASILTLLDGGVITARGTGDVGKNYYVRNGLIESAAPNLTPNEIVI